MLSFSNPLPLLPIAWLSIIFLTWTTQHFCEQLWLIFCSFTNRSLVVISRGSGSSMQARLSRSLGLQTCLSSASGCEWLFSPKAFTISHWQVSSHNWGDIWKKIGVFRCLPNPCRSLATYKVVASFFHTPLFFQLIQLLCEWNLRGAGALEF